MAKRRDSRIAPVDPQAVSFQRAPTDNWTTEVAGSRWFKADLHVHTLDDLPGGRVKVPPGINQDPQSDEGMITYSRRLLQAAIKRGIQVLGLTPHSPKLGATPDTSLTWKIVDEWNHGRDDDDIPFCDKIYAVFPGFEPSLKTGQSGLHLIFLFDPEIGRNRFFELFTLIMNGVAPWCENQLQMSSNTADDVFLTIRKFHKRYSQESKHAYGWNYLILAPHIEADKGLLGAQKSQVLRSFKHGAIAALELGDHKIPADVTKNRSWLYEGMLAYRQAFFHSSDAYTFEHIGWRYTWVKLASPRIEALRQAFIAKDSRLRIAFDKTESGDMVPTNTPPHITSIERPWLKSVTLRGGMSFFHQDSSTDDSETTFVLNPDLTCIIGGSMTGKSALLDGLRVHTEAPLPADESIRKQVEARGWGRFADRITRIELDCPGQHPSKLSRERWPAQFFTQNELQRLSQDQSAIQEVLSRLVASETQTIEGLESELQEMDKELYKLAIKHDKLDQDVADAEQAYDRAKRAKDLLAEYEEAGFDAYYQVGKTLQIWQKANEEAHSVQSKVAAAIEIARDIDTQNVKKSLSRLSIDNEIDIKALKLKKRCDQIVAHLESGRRLFEEWSQDVDRVIHALKECQIERRTAMETALIGRGISGLIPDLRAFSRRAALLPVCSSTLQDTKKKRTRCRRAFGRLLDARDGLVHRQRESFDRVVQVIEREFRGKIRVKRFDHGSQEKLYTFLTAFKQRGITRWWNNLEENERPSPRELVGYLDDHSLGAVHMTDPVQEKFRECLTKSMRRKLLALRCPDRYLLELRLDDGQYRGVHELSGGQRVGLLLSLLLQTSDNRPLVIDQPEDELDNRFLFDTILPALKKLKGHRQVIVATHNANIVVNGDADLVIELEAVADRGWIANSGTIDDPSVRNAIVRTVDGGVEAFQLRQKKYGF